MWLDVHVEGREPYRVKHECMVKAGKHPWPGTTLPVVVDREKPERGSTSSGRSSRPSMSGWPPVDPRRPQRASRR